MSQNLNGKIMGALIAGAVALGGGVAAVTTSKKAPAPVAQPLVQVVAMPPSAPIYRPREGVARTWGTMNAAEMAAVQTALKGMPTSKVEIYCGGSFCLDLAEDLDEMLEASGFDSYLQWALLDLGKGMGISPVNDQTRKIAAAIRDATGGRIMLDLLAPTDQAGKEIKVPDNTIVIAFGRKKAPKP